MLPACCCEIHAVLLIVTQPLRPSSPRAHHQTHSAYLAAAKPHFLVEMDPRSRTVCQSSSPGSNSCKQTSQDSLRPANLPQHGSLCHHSRRLRDPGAHLASLPPSKVLTVTRVCKTCLKLFKESDKISRARVCVSRSRDPTNDTIRDMPGLRRRHRDPISSTASYGRLHQKRRPGSGRWLLT